MPKLRTLLFATLGILAALAPARADYPEKQITMVVCFPAGGGTDIAARLVNIPLGEALGKPVVIENRGGAGGNIAHRRGQAAAGRRLHAAGLLQRLRGQSEPLRAGRLRSAEGLHPADGDGRLAQRVRRAGAISPIKSMKEFIDKAKASPGKMNWTSPGAGTTPQLAGELLKLRTGIDMQHIPFPGAGPATNAVLAGTVDLYTANIGSLQGLIDGGKVRPIAVTPTKRWAPLPDVPTLEEIGVKDAASDTFQGVYVLAGTPQPIVDRLAKELTAILRPSPTSRRSSTRSACRWWPRARPQFRKRVEREVPMFKEIIDKAGLRIP